jgi:hypothetical protein
MVVPFSTTPYPITYAKIWRSYRSEHIIFPTLPYAEALVEAGVDSLFNRRQILTTKLFNDIANDESHKLYQLLPSKNFSNYNMRKENIFNVAISRTNRFKNSFIQHNSTMYYFR